MAFYSETRAFMFDLQNGKVVEWNPKDMTVTGDINVSIPPTNFSFAANARVFGSKIFVSLSGIDFDNGLRMRDRADIALFDVNTKSITYKSDSRLASSYVNVMDSRGNVYLTPSRDEHNALLYGPNSAVTNWGRMTRFNMNTGEFDPSFNMDLKAITGQVPSKVFLLNDDEVLLEYTMMPLPAIASVNNYFAVARANMKKVNLRTSQVTDVTGLSGNVQAYTNDVDLVIDGALYYPASVFPNNDYNQFSTRLYKVTGNTASLLFTSVNAVPLAIERIR